MRPVDRQERAQILLRFEPGQNHYALNYPLHPSQQLVAETNEEIRLRVYDTHERRMELPSYGPEAEVLAPADLRARLRKQHRAASDYEPAATAAP